MKVVTLPHPNTFLVVEPLNYNNAYDFNKPHKHDYFEIILINKGGVPPLFIYTCFVFFQFHLFPYI